MSRDPPEGGTALQIVEDEDSFTFPISRDPPEGGTYEHSQRLPDCCPGFPISRDPPEGGTGRSSGQCWSTEPPKFPISRDPPEGGTPDH